MDGSSAARFVDQWVAGWNAHDLDATLSHYRDDVVFTSPVARHVLEGSDGVVRGKEELRRYWSEGLRRIPDLHFDVTDFYVGVDTVVIAYRNQNGVPVVEVLTFEGDLVREGHGTYLVTVSNPAGVRPA
jgi:ketosteroid isomerase-like protein